MCTVLRTTVCLSWKQYKVKSVQDLSVQFFFLSWWWCLYSMVQKCHDCSSCSGCTGHFQTSSLTTVFIVCVICINSLNICILTMLYIPFSMVTRLWAGWCRVWFLAYQKHFSPLLNTQTDPWAHPASFLMGTRGYFAWCKVAGVRCCHAPPSGAVVKNSRSFTSPPPTCHHKFVLCLVWFLQHNVSCLVFTVVVNGGVLCEVWTEVLIWSLMFRVLAICQVNFRC